MDILRLETAVPLVLTIRFPLLPSPVNFGASTINSQRMSLKASQRMSLEAFLKHKEEIEQNIVVLKMLMQILTFAQLGALLYNFLCEQWDKRHEFADTLKKLCCCRCCRCRCCRQQQRTAESRKKRASSSIGGRLSSKGESGNNDSSVSTPSHPSRDVDAPVTVVVGDNNAAPSEADKGGVGGGGGGGGGDKSGVELQAMSRSASTEMDVANPFRERGRSTPSGADLSNGGGDKSGFELQSMSRRVSTGMDEISV